MFMLILKGEMVQNPYGMLNHHRKPAGNALHLHHAADIMSKGVTGSGRRRYLSPYTQKTFIALPSIT